MYVPNLLYFPLIESSLYAWRQEMRLSAKVLSKFASINLDNSEYQNMVIFQVIITLGCREEYVGLNKLFLACSCCAWYKYRIRSVGVYAGLIFPQIEPTGDSVLSIMICLRWYVGSLPSVHTR